VPLQYFLVFKALNTSDTKRLFLFGDLGGSESSIVAFTIAMVLGILLVALKNERRA
jgi:uncharacterized integral membrane protein